MIGEHGADIRATLDVTYVVSILAKSLERSYVIANISWLIGKSIGRLEVVHDIHLSMAASVCTGSAGTIALDAIVLGQFIYFSRLDKRVVLEEDDLE